MMKVLLIDDHSLIRTGIRSAIENSKLTADIIEAHTLGHAREVIAMEKPDLVVLDISLPDGNGMDFARELREESDVKIIMLSMYEDYDYVSRCLDIGVDGYVLKSEGLEIVEAIEDVIDDKDYYSSGVRELIVQHYTNYKKKRTTTPDPVKLTNREKEILKFVTRGKTSQEIADMLFISTRTVDTHRSNIMRKLEVKNSIALINRAQELSLLT